MLGNMKTYAENKKDYYVVNGTRSWVTGRLSSDFIMTVITNPNLGK